MRPDSNFPVIQGTCYPIQFAAGKRRLFHLNIQSPIDVYTESPCSRPIRRMHIFHSSIRTVCNMLNCIFPRRIVAIALHAERGVLQIKGSNTRRKGARMHSGEGTAKNSVALTPESRNQTRAAELLFGYSFYSVKLFPSVSFYRCDCYLLRNKEISPNYLSRILLKEIEPR